MAARCDFAALEVDVDVFPVGEGAGDFAVGFLVNGPEAVHGIVGEDDAPAEGVVGAITFDDRYIPVGTALLEENRQVQSRRPTAKTNNLHKHSALGIQHSAGSRRREPSS